jgi:hypothetical protein
MGGTKTSSGMTSGVFARRALRLFKNWKKARRGDNSYAGEFEYLRSLLKKLNITGGFLVDIAASDGVNQSCTLGFLSSGGWEGLAVEMDPEKFANLAFIFSQFAGVKLARNKVTPENVEAVLVSNAVPRDFTLLNLDIDSYDLTVMEEILNAGFRPAVISMEVNEKIPPPVYFRVNFDDSHFWKGDHFYGCSLAAAASIMKPRGYKLESLQFNNAVFVREDLAAGIISDLSAEEAYDQGYRRQTDRKRLFPWNANVESALGSTAEENVRFFRELFKDYQGKFTLAAAPPEPERNSQPQRL